MEIAFVCVVVLTILSFLFVISTINKNHDAHHDTMVQVIADYSDKLNKANENSDIGRVKAHSIIVGKESAFSLVRVAIFKMGESGDLFGADTILDNMFSQIKMLETNHEEWQKWASEFNKHIESKKKGD